MNPLQVLQGVHAKVEGHGCTEWLTGRGRGRGEVKVVRVAGEVQGGIGRCGSMIGRLLHVQCMNMYVAEERSN